MPLESSSLFERLSPPDRVALEGMMQPCAFAAEEVIFEAGDPGDAAYLITSGEVRVEVDVPEVDSEGVLAYLEAGALLGEIALLDHKPRSARAVAHSAVMAKRIGAAELDSLGEAHPSAVLIVMRALGKDAATKLRSTTSRLASEIFSTMANPEVDAQVARSVVAQRAFVEWSEEAVDGLLAALAAAIAAQARELAEFTVEQTGLGSVVDKTWKNEIASQGIAKSLVGERGVGVLSDSDGVIELAAPVGVIFGLIPLTNPVATAIFKTLIALKCRNAIILSFHHAALGIAARVGAILTSVLEEHGAPAGLVQWVDKRASRRKTESFMRHSDVALILATGGSGMVRSAYSSGTPALGVGPGNAPALVTADADLEHAARSVVASKSFDNGLICGAEHSLVVEARAGVEFSRQLERYGAAVLSESEGERFALAAVDPASGRFRSEMIGQSAARIAGVVKIERPWPIRLIVVPRPWQDRADVWTTEKMTPVLSLFEVGSADEGIEVARRLLSFDGAGHTAIVHTGDEDLGERFGRSIPTSRVLLNSPGSHGVVGFTTGLVPSFTLGCGTFGGNSTTDNVSFSHLRNVKRIARFVDPISRGLELPPGYPEAVVLEE